MKKFNIYLTFIFIFIIAFCTNIFASTTTYPRTEEDLGIDKNFTITSTVKNAALATPKVDASEKVYDFANLFTEQEELSLYNAITNYINSYNMDMAVVTIDNNNKYSAMDYADDFYDYNNFGIGNKYDGLLFLIDMDTREMWISTTGQAILIYDDYRIDKILDATYSYISKQQYYECANAFIEKSSSYAGNGIPSSNKNYKLDENGNYVRKSNSEKSFPIIGMLIFSGIVTVIFLAIAASKHKTIKKATQAKEYLVKDSFNLTVNEDRFITSNTTKVYDPPSSSSSSSSSGGGSSTHSSSSGTSHGGGGRSF